MIFSIPSIQAIMDTSKAHTRLICKAGETYTSAWQIGDVLESTIRASAIYSAAGRIKWQVERDYAIQPGRGKPGVWWRNGTLRATNRDVCELLTIKRRQFYIDFNADNPDLIESCMRLDGWKPLRIRIRGVRQEDVRTISAADVAAEGFDRIDDFWEVWCGFHDPEVFPSLPSLNSESILATQPDERYLAWVLEFEVVT